MATFPGVSDRNDLYGVFSTKWKKCRDVIAGQDTIHEAGQAYLSRLVEETDDEYNARVDRTPFFNASYRTVAAFVGMIFRKPITLDAPEKLKELLEDVTLTGVSFENLARNCVYDDLTTSWLGVYVDHPSQVVKEDGTSLSVAEAEKLGLRPSMTMYPAECIYDWDFTRINNKQVLTQVRLLEYETVRVSEFKTKKVERIRVLDLIDGVYRIRIMDKETEEQVGTDNYPTINGQKLDEIPFYFIGPDGTDAVLDDPVMIDLFNHNIMHYKVSADYEHACHMTALPTPYVTGVQAGVGADGKPVEQKFYIGSTRVMLLPDVNSKFEFAEFSGAGIEAIKTNLDGKKEEMAALGARALAPEKAGVEAEGTLVIRTTGENSIVGAVALAVSEGLTKALSMFARWAGYSEKVKAALNRDLVPLSVDPSTLQSWIGAVQAGLMSHNTFFYLIQRADLVEPGIDFEAEQARIDSEPPMPPAQNPANPASTNHPDNPNNPQNKPDNVLPIGKKKETK